MTRRAIFRDGWNVCLTSWEAVISWWQQCSTSWDLISKLALIVFWLVDNFFSFWSTVQVEVVWVSSPPNHRKLFCKILQLYDCIPPTPRDLFPIYSQPWTQQKTRNNYLDTDQMISYFVTNSTLINKSQEIFCFKTCIEKCSGICLKALC